MDLAYDHIQEEAFRKEEESGQAEAQSPQESSTLNNDIQVAYKAFSSSPWGAKIGGFFGNVVKQGETVYKEASQEISAVGSEATKGLSGWRDTIISHTRSLSLVNQGEETSQPGSSSSGDKDAPRELSTDEALKESETVLSRLRVEAAKRLKDIQKAEDAADEALLKFGTNIRDFLREAISIAPPSAAAEGASGNTVLFESKDAQGKRVIHTSRFDAQLHVIHTTVDSFVKDAASDEFTTWSENFNVEEKTDEIAKDLAKFPELRTTMEKLVPDQIPYADFWKRYYFLRHSIETAEARRRDLLKAAAAEEEVGWDEDSDDEAGPSKTDKQPRPTSAGSSTTIHPPKATNQGLLKLSEPRKSNDEKSQPDSEASYDVVGAASGNPSQAPNSPKESRKGEDSDEEDWE